ncbi:MAG: hypothetical protein MZV70_73055 [Desulfobacterales bacterium]|nr:hypothetical protein [Desulfobacterales bacterium]
MSCPRGSPDSELPASILGTRIENATTSPSWAISGTPSRRRRAVRTRDNEGAATEPRGRDRRSPGPGGGYRTIPTPLEKYLVPARPLRGRRCSRAIHPPQLHGWKPSRRYQSHPGGARRPQGLRLHHAMGKDLLDPGVQCPSLWERIWYSAPLFLMDFHKAPRIAVLPWAGPSLSGQTIKRLLKRLP